MRNFFAIILIFVVIYMFSLLTLFFTTSEKDDTELETSLLSTAVDYAGEAAMLACIDREHLSMDYSTEDILFTPDYIADAFAASMCISYGLPTTVENIERITSCIPVMVLATNNGYFIAEWKQKDDDTSELIWEPKKPYIIDSNPDSQSGTIYCVQLNREAATIIDKSTLSVTETTDYTSVPYSAEQVYQYANKTINNSVNAVLARYMKSFNRSEIDSFYLPVAANSHSGVNRVEQPTLIIIVRGLSINGSVQIDTSVVSGIRIDDRNYIVGWTSADGTRYYARYSSAAGQEALNNSGVLFSSAANAAKAGYVPYLN